MTASPTVTCLGCATEVEVLDLFPGVLCLTCFAASPEGQRIPTADEVVALWGGPARRKS